MIRKRIMQIKQTPEAQYLRGLLQVLKKWKMTEMEKTYEEKEITIPAA